MTVKFEEASADILPAMAPYFEAEWQEVGEMKDVLHLNVNFPLFQAAMQAGRAVLFLAKTTDEIVGYSAYTIGPHPKYMGTMWAFGAGIWLRPDHRGGRTALRMLTFCEDGLRKRGVNFILAGSRVNHDASGSLLEHLGYVPHEIARIKHLT